MVEQFLFGQFALGDIVLDRHKTLDLACIIRHRCDRLFLIIQLAILTPVDEYALPGFSIQ